MACMDATRLGTAFLHGLTCSVWIFAAGFGALEGCPAFFVLLLAASRDDADR